MRWSRFRSLIASRRGNAVLEFAFAVPVLALISLNTFELGRYALAHLKMYNAASSTADLASRDETLSSAQINDILSAAQHIVRPFDLTDDGTVIITGVSADVDNAPEVFWQYSGAGSLGATSEVGTTVGDPANIPSEVPIRAQETIIVAEVFYRYRPMFIDLIPETIIRSISYHRPRLGSLRTVN